MNGLFDLGGVDGLGPVDPPAEEAIFRAEWEKSIFAMFSALFRAGWYGLDSFRHGIEVMDPVVYLKSPYYEHWLHSFEVAGARNGELDLDELDRRTQYYLDNPDAPLPDHQPSQELLDFANAIGPAGVPAQRPTDKPVNFAVGDVVRVSIMAPLGHTRLARYVRGKTGVVIAHRGSFIYPDAAGNLLGEDPQHVYTVQFDGTELWGANAEPNTTVTFDVWDPYITHANQSAGAIA
ncbi:MAG TPA: nitrile hydratase subunit beta [Nocardioides sp.]|uniref:nitrile hydratase subunit beta n=1 Tax=uncultured Nocardioides sp. TaxID=198441 RepID=UPI00262BA37E|nr:nitrile hydratase subunit beta [uncultured Nocardioides sp.]HRI94124.1 nitrile hydratase subunit beta [Nocardioides sp.]HRK44094.1 nitrile hydratase subunit beta [Nocardioides sp.]